MDVESTAEADGDGSHLAAMSAEGKNKSKGRQSGKREWRRGHRQGSFDPPDLRRSDQSRGLHRRNPDLDGGGGRSPDGTAAGTSSG